MKYLFMPMLMISLVTCGQIPISEARQLRSGRIVTVNGHVTATFGQLSFIQDPTGAIAIYGVHVSLNDSISITGKLSKFNGLLEIIGDSVKYFGQTPPLIPKVVNRIIDYEAELVRIENVFVKPTGLFFYPQRAGLLLKNNDTIQYWIDENTDIPGYMIPVSSNVTGVVGRYGDRFQIMPRSSVDIGNLNIQYPVSNNQLRIMTWNIEFFGANRYGPSNDSLQIANVATVLNATRPDIVALQEVSNDDAFRSLINLTPGYEGRCSNRYSWSFDTSGDFPPQKLCFVYKKSTVKVVREKILFRKMFDDNPTDMFSSGRLPYLLEVETANRRLHLINIHAKSGDDENSYSRRLMDARLLKDTIDTYDDLILLGDFNDDVDQSITAGRESPYTIFENCVSVSLSEAGWHSTISYNDVIDHQVISPSLVDYHVSTGILNVFSLIPLYGKTTSDHLPVFTDFNFTVSGINDGVSTVFPNPTDGDLWFPPGSDITVINSLGQTIIKKQNAHPPISLSECAPGLYSVMVEDQLFRIARN